MKTKALFTAVFTGVFVLLAAASCNREPKVPDNPTYDPVGNTVKAQFTLSVSTNNGPEQTKTTAQFAQAENNPFLGMEQVHMLTYKINYGEGAKTFFYNPYKGSEKVAATRDYDLGMLLPQGSVTSTQQTRTVELAIPLETNCVLLYGKAQKTYDSDTQGDVTLSGDPNDLSTLKFGLVSRMDNEKKFKVGAVAFTRILNYILCAGLVDEVRDATTGRGFWKATTGYQDKTYGFWWPLEGAPADAGSSDGVWNAAHTHQWHTGQLSWKQLGWMYRYKYDNNTSTDPAKVTEKTAKSFADIPPLGEVLGEAYEAITTIQSSEDGAKTELRSGSAASFHRTMEDLYAIVERTSSAHATSWQEYVVKMLAQEVKLRMDKFFVMTSSGKFLFKTASEDGVFTAEEISALISELSQYTNPTDGWNTNDMTTYFNKDYFPYEGNVGFPVNIGLPLGSAVMVCDIDNTDIDAGLGSKGMDTFRFVTDIPAYGMGGATFPIKNYRYPPELMYYGNSPIRVTDAVFTGWPATLGAWDNIGNWSTRGWTGSTAAGEVSSSTRSVAMINHVNYGTALLKSRVMFDNGVTVLKDNNHAIHENEQDNDVPIDGLVVTGIVVGGQPDFVGWDYTRIAVNDPGEWKWDSTDGHFYKAGDGKVAISFEGNQFDKMIYDKVASLPISSYIAEASETTDNKVTPIYTFCWDNYDALKDAANQQDVYVALEIKNNTDSDFWGELNLIRKGGTFYLVGKLDCSEATKPVSGDWDLNRYANAEKTSLNYQYPPFNPANGETIQVPRVFMQDYVTTANLILKQGCLKHAYVTVPDLRSSQISLGLAIDMKWEKGMTFDVVMGGE